GPSEEQPPGSAASRRFLFFSRNKAMAEMSDSNLDKTTIIQQAIASCCAAIIASLFALDVTKNRLQGPNNPFSKGKFVNSHGFVDHICGCENGESKPWCNKPGHFKGTLDAFVKIIQIEGIKSLWSGLPPTLIMALPTTVVYLAFCDQWSEALKSRLGKDDEHIVTLAMCWCHYECFRKMMCKEAHEPTFLIAFTSAAASGSTAAVITPCDVVKTHKQAELWEGETLKSELLRDRASTWAVMRKIVAKNGITLLFAGIILRLFKVAPAIMISTYECRKSIFSHLNKK
ncbi:LOW QUALITY PROTEIN: mitochondrial glutathione transporter SLC25A40, partial [Leptosomus discolor]